MLNLRVAPVQLLLLVPAFLCAATVVSAQTTPIRSKVVLVPLDIRVLDRNGVPVTDLAAGDFSVYENDIRQEIAHFVPLPLVPGGEAQVRPLPDDHPLASATSSHRTFVFVLGRGHLNAPVQALDALIEFVQQRLVSTDRVAVVAYLKTSEPTTDHASVLRFLEQYRELHQDIEERIARPRLKDPLGPLDADTQSRIRALFAGPGLPSFTDLPGASTMRRSKFGNWVYLRWTIFNLRRVAGEKHVVLIAKDPLPLARITENPNGNIFVKLANEARVTLSYIHTGGVPSMIRLPTRALGPRLSGRLPQIDHGDFFAPTDHRLLAQYTGGTASYYSQATRPLERLERATRFQYVLGYYPTVSLSADTQRMIRVVVHRKDATAQYRHGYRLAASAEDERDLYETVADYRIRTELQRLAETRAYTEFRGRGITPPLRITTRHGADGNNITVSLAFNPSYSLDGDDATKRAEFHVVVILDDASGAPVGELRQTIPLTLSARELAQAKNKWVEFDLNVPVKGKSARVRAALYDAENDRLLSNISGVRAR